MNQKQAQIAFRRHKGMSSVAREELAARLANEQHWAYCRVCKRQITGTPRELLEHKHE